MINLKSPASFTSAGILSAIAASLCCITPVAAVLAGSSSLATIFSWLEPARPFLVGFSIGALAVAWYLQLKPASTIYKACCETRKTSFFQSKTSLGFVTLFAILGMTLPLYANLFYSKPKTQVVSKTGTLNIQQVKFTINGMTCASCEDHVNQELSKENGVLAYTTSYASRSSMVSFDYSKTSVNAIEAAINRSGYKVKRYELVPVSNAADSFHLSSFSSKSKMKSCCQKVQ